VNNPPDHEGISIVCDPHTFDHLEGADQWQGPYSHFRRCVYQRDTFHYALDYAREFWNAYSTERKVFLVNLLDFHEGT
jgi:hypothetical protein